MRINTKQGLAPIAAIIIALLVIGGGAYGIKKAMDKKAAGGEPEKQSAEEVETRMPVPGTDTKETDIMKVPPAKKDSAVTSDPTTLQVKLDEQNMSGRGGQAVIVQIGTSTVRVIVNLVGKPSLEAEPAHIHLGSCPNPGIVKYPLTNVGNGASQTNIPNMTLRQLLLELPLAINVHKSADDLKAYVSCGDILANQAKVKVTYSIDGFTPDTIRIKKGDTVLFENVPGKQASIASNEHPAHLLYPEFDQYKTNQRGKTEFRFTFDKVGTWKYHDHLNSTMTGTVVVE